MLFISRHISMVYSFIKSKLQQETSLSHYYLSSLIYSIIILTFLIPDLYTQGAESFYVWACKILFALAITVMNCFIWLVLSRFSHANKRIPALLLFSFSHCLGSLFFASSLLHFYAFQEHWSMFSLTNAYSGMMAGQAPLNLSIFKIVSALLVFFISISSLLICCKLVLPKKLTLKNVKPLRHMTALALVLLLVCSAQYWLPSTDATSTVSELSPIATLVKNNPRYKVEDFELQTLANQEQARIRTIAQLSLLQEQDFHITAATPAQADVLFIHIEGFRADMLNEETTPNLHAFAQKNIHLRDHYSSSNNTPNSTFSLLSGLSGDYFQEFRAKPSPLAPIQLLKKSGYSFNIFHGSSLRYENLDRLIYSDFTQHQSSGSSYYDKDQTNINTYLSSLDNKSSGKRFDYLVMDSSHFPYHYPASFEKFTPALSADFEISSSNFSHLSDKQLDIKNRYKNSLHYIDSLLGELLNKLEEKSLLDNRVVVIYGDHGEEFWEKNRFGHSFALNNEQIKVAGIIALPKNNSRTVQYKYSSHQDFMPTILNYIGITQFGHLYNGKDLLNYRQALDYAKVSMGVVRSTKRYEYAIIAKGKKVIYTLSSELEISDISLENDQQTQEWSHDEIREIIMISENHTLNNQKSKTL